MGVDITAVRVGEDITLRRVAPTRLPAVVEGGEVFTPGEPISINSAGRVIRASSNSVDIVGISGQSAAGLSVNAPIVVYQLGDGSLWHWRCTRFARDGAGTVVTPQQSDIGDLAGLLLVGGNWIVDTGASNKVVQVIGFISNSVFIRFLRTAVAQGVVSGSLVFSSGLVSFTEITPGDVVTTGAFGGVRNRLHQVGDVGGGGSFTPDNTLFNAFRLRPTGNITLNNPSTNPANDETQILTFHFVSDGTSRTVTLGALYELPGSPASFTTDATAGKEQVLSCSWNGTNWRCILSDATG